MILKINPEEDKSYKFIALSPDAKKFDIDIKSDGAVSINKKKTIISVEEASDGFTYINWDKKRIPVQILEKNQNKYHVLINGISYNFSIETPISYERKKFLEKNKQDSKVENIISPMPGKIIDVLVEPGMAIKDGDPIIILEAMKMQNEILSHVSGKVTKVNSKIDDTVMKDEILVEIEK